MNPYIGDRPLDPPESDYECRGCGMQFNGLGTLSHHVERCVKALLLVADEDELEDCMPDMTDPGEPNDETDL